MNGSTAGAEEQRHRLVTLATRASVAIAVTLILIKAGAWLMTGSVSLLSSMIDSTLDAATSLVNLLAVRHAWTPADADHRFGHGKAEPLAALFQAAFMSGAALLVMAEAISRLITPEPMTQTGIGLGVMGVSLVLTIGLVLLQRHVVKITQSVAVEADSLHYFTDILSNIAVIIALGLATYGDMGWADPVIGLLIAGFLLYSAKEVGGKALDFLMDKELPDHERTQIGEIIKSVPNVAGFHRLRTRSSGTRRFIEFDMQMNGDITLSEAHFITHDVIGALKNVFPDADILIHQEPEGPESRLDEPCWGFGKKSP